ncbi:hypothetical protein L9F63_026281, partial [Diploptera punctata]
MNGNVFCIANPQPTITKLSLDHSLRSLLPSTYIQGNDAKLWNNIPDNQNPNAQYQSLTQSRPGKYQIQVTPQPEIAKYQPGTGSYNQQTGQYLLVPPAQGVFTPNSPSITYQPGT